MASVKEIGSGRFEAEVLHSGRAALVDFYAPWCGPCKALATTVERMAFVFEDRLDVYKVNVDEEPALAEQFDVVAVPTLLFFKDGREQFRTGGIVPPPKLYDRIEELVGTVKDPTTR